MKERVYRLGCTWQFIENPDKTEIDCSTQSEELDNLSMIAITGCITVQVCVLKKGDKYGVFTCDHTNGMGGPGVWCSPTVDPFPYDEVKYCAFPWDKEYGLFAFRIGNKWGIIKVVDGRNEEEGVYDFETPLTKRRIVVPCKYVALEDAEIQLGNTYDWMDPFEEDEPTKDPSKRVVTKGTGKDKIRVTFPDGMIIEESLVWKTLAETIKRIGVERVEKLKIPGISKRNIPLLDTHLTDDITYKESQKEIEPGYYLLTYNSTEKKAQYLEQISDELHLNLKIEIVSY